MKTRSKNEPVRVGWASAHSIMKCVYPLLPIKAVTQAFCLSRALAVPALSQPPWMLFTVIIPLASCPLRLELSWLFEEFHNSFFVMDTPQIFPQQILGGRTDVGRWLFFEAVHEMHNEPPDGRYKAGERWRDNLQTSWATQRFRVCLPFSEWHWCYWKGVASVIKRLHPKQIKITAF